MPLFEQLLNRITGSSQARTSDTRGEPHNSMFNNATINEINGGTFQMGPSEADTARDLLAKHIAPNALPDSDAMYDGPKCYPETRNAIHRKLARWIRQRDDLDTKFIWLHGGAGAGKSAIMRTTALGGPSKQDDYSDNPHVLGSYFFSRRDTTRNTARALIPTLALQLCDAHPAARDIILQTISNKRERIFTTSLRNQVRSLLLEPLRRLESQCGWLSRAEQVKDEEQPGRIFLIDGLDECAETKKQGEIIDALAFLVHELPVRVLVASRLDEPIPSAIRNNPDLRDILSEISLSDDPDSNADIWLFLEQALKQVREQRAGLPFCTLPESWPGYSDIYNLVQKASGHFIYASTATRYIASGEERPDIALRVILGMQAPRTGQPFAELDTLYRHILSKARFQKEVLEIISFCIFSSIRRCYVSAICEVLGYPPDDISHFLSDMRALVVIHPGKAENKDHDDEPFVRVQHKSLEDFLQDRSRAQKLFVGTERQFHRDHLKCYFAVLNLMSTCSVPRVITNQVVRVDDLVRDIACGIASSPLSDVVSAHIRDHNPQLMYTLIEKHSAHKGTKMYRYYMQAIGQYDFDNQHVYLDSLKDLLGVQRGMLPQQVSDGRLDDIVIPLLLEGFDIGVLRDIAYAGWLFVETDFDCTVHTFHKRDGYYAVEPWLCHHYYPIHLLRQIRKELADADNDLANATLKMLKMLVGGRDTFPQCRWEYIPRHLFGSMLKAVTFVLPKVVYRADIAKYTMQPLSTSPQSNGTRDHQNHLKYTDSEMDLITSRARRAMENYSRRSAYRGNGNTNIGGSGSGDRLDNDDPSSIKGEILVGGYEPGCRYCNKDVDYFLEKSRGYSFW